MKCQSETEKKLPESPYSFNPIYQSLLHKFDGHSLWQNTDTGVGVGE